MLRELKGRWGAAESTGRELGPRPALGLPARKGVPEASSGVQWQLRMRKPKGQLAQVEWMGAAASGQLKVVE